MWRVCSRALFTISSFISFTWKLLFCMVGVLFSISMIFLRDGSWEHGSLNFLYSPFSCPEGNNLAGSVTGGLSSPFPVIPPRMRHHHCCFTQLRAPVSPHSFSSPFISALHRLLGPAHFLVEVHPLECPCEDLLVWILLAFLWKSLFHPCIGEICRLAITFFPSSQ